jgi:DNA-binding transcriptional LysR family regulator
MSIELHELRGFVALAQTLNFRVAAGALHITQPALTRKIKALEDKLGGPLFARDRRGVALLPAGQVLLDGSTRLFLELEALLVQIQRTLRGEAGALRIGFGAATISHVLHRAVAAFRRKHPKVELTLRDMSSTAQLQALHDEVLDVGFVRLPVREPQLRTMRVTSDRVVLAVPKLPEYDHIRSLRDATSAPFILIAADQSRSFYDHSLALCSTAGFQPRVVQLAHEFFTMVNLSGVGLGVSLVAQSARSSSVPNIRWVDVAHSEWQIGLAWRRADASPLVASLVEVVRQSVTAA